MVKLAADPEVIVFNLKRRYTGVSATVNALLALQAEQWELGYCGTALPVVPQGGMTLWQALRVSLRPPVGRAVRVWHVRRDPEMLAGIFARDILRLPIKLVFTSAAQRQHGRFVRGLIRRMDAVIAVTPQAAQYLESVAAIVPHGVDTERFLAPADKLESWRASGLPGRVGVGIFGRVRPEKGVDLFVDAVLRVLPEFPEATAVIVGLVQPAHQAFADDLRQRIERAGLGERVLWVGEVDAAEVHLWYQRCLVCVAVPRYEAFGLTPFEAAASGCAVICSNTGAFNLLAQANETGELIGLQDVDALEATLRNMLNDPDATSAMGVRARQRVCERFSHEAEAQGIGEVYRSLLGGAVTSCH